MVWQVEVWPIDKLMPYLRNPRKNDAAVDRMMASIHEFGFKIPILARSSGEIVDGHLRHKAAKKLGMELKQTSKALANLAHKFDRFDDRITVQTRDQDQRLRKLERKRGA